jgi:hypothetical protein
MNRNRLTFALCLWGAVALASPPAPEVVAKRLVQSTGIAQGDLVRVSGSTKDLPLLTAIALEVEKAGGASFFAPVATNRFAAPAMRFPPSATRGTRPPP